MLFTAINLLYKHVAWVYPVIFSQRSVFQLALGAHENTDYLEEILGCILTEHNSITFNVLPSSILLFTQ